MGKGKIAVNWRSAAAVFAGGCIGTALRTSVTGLLPSGATAWDSWGLPWGTLLVNLCGAFLLGCINGFFDRRATLSPHIKFFFATGMMGAFTTYGTLVSEVHSAQALLGALYLATSLFFGVVLAYVGLLAGPRIGGHRVKGHSR